jgi:hypothetical protein
VGKNKGMTSSLVALLQGALFLLSALQTNHQLSDATRAQILSTATQAVELASLEAGTPSTASIAPNLERLQAAEYLDKNGIRTHLDGTMLLVSGYISFGDLDHDTNDDAIVLIKDAHTSPASYHLAVMLNNHGSLFNVANLPLPNLKEIYTHQIQGGIFTLEYSTTDGVRKTVKYTFSSGLTAL